MAFVVAAPAALAAARGQRVTPSRARAPLTTRHSRGARLCPHSEVIRPRKERSIVGPLDVGGRQNAEQHYDGCVGVARRAGAARALSPEKKGSAGVRGAYREEMSKVTINE